jgi:hypothetical protein
MSSSFKNLVYVVVHTYEREYPQFLYVSQTVNKHVTINFVAHLTSRHPHVINLKVFPYAAFYYIMHGKGDLTLVC